MRSLLWCEWRSRRFWLIALAASVIAPILFGDPLTFWYGWIKDNYLTDALTPCMIIGLLFGLMAFSGELGAGVQDFLLSRPVSWKKLLAAKLIVGLGMIVVSALLGLIAFRMVCPAQYLPFLTFSKLAGGFIGAVAVTSLFYIVGMACSVVLPGAVGAVLMILVVPVTAGLLLLAVSSVAQILGITELSTLPQNSPWIAILPWMVGITFAALLIIRFGLTLSVAQRIRRYALTALVGAFCVGAVMLPFFTGGASVVSAYYCNFSPDLSHAVVTFNKRTCAKSTIDYSGEMIDDKYQTCFWRGSDGLIYNISRRVAYQAESMQWLDDNTAFFIRGGTSYPSHRVLMASITTLDLDKSGKLRIKASPLGYNIYFAERNFVSPDGRTAAFGGRFKNGADEDTAWPVHFWDIETRRWLGTKIRRGRYYNGNWWQSDTEYAWLDAKNVRHSVRVR